MSQRRKSFAGQLGMRGLGLVALGAVLVVHLQGCGTHSDGGATVSEATPSPFVRLDRGAHPLARPELDRGRLDPTQHIANLSLFFKPSAAQIAERDALRDAQLNPGSPSYHKWLTPEEYAARFGATADDIARTIAWAKSQGFDVHATSRLGSRVSFSASAGQLEAAFHTEMHRYEVAGKMHYAMSTAPSVPRELSDLIVGLHNSHDFYPQHVGHEIRIAPDTTCPTGGDCTKGGNGIAPPDWENIYDVTPLYTTGVSGKAVDGTGITIAIVGVAAISQNDINAFRTFQGLAAAPGPVIVTPVPDTGAASTDTGGAGLEAILDTEWSGSIARNATINYVVAGADSENPDDAAYYAIEENLAPILSESFGGAEAGTSASDADITAINGSAANLLGITYLAAAGDAGAATGLGNEGTVAGLYVSLPASLPSVTAVGGTEFPTGSLTLSGGVATGYSTLETTWNEGANPNSRKGLAAGGGGISSVFSRPSYQLDLAACTVVGSLPVTEPGPMRQVPDVAFTAAETNNGIFVECAFNADGSDCAGTGTGTPSVVEIGGTSASSPAFAGVVALLNQAVGDRLGNINPMLYQLNTSVPTAFHDITTGDNEIDCTAGTDVGCPTTGGKYGFAAKAGYDCATGLGSVDVDKLVTAWAGLAPTSTTLVADPSATTEGTKISLAATVDVTKVDPETLGGTVTYSFQSYDAAGEPDLSWTLGTADIASSATTATGTATLSVAIPPGLVNPLAQYVDVVAQYGGDAHHLASTSAKTRVTFSTVALCITPGTTTVAKGAKFTYASEGGIGAVKWYVGSDTTCSPTDETGATCSQLDETTGAFTAGTGQAGWVTVSAIDGSGAETLGEVTVGAPTGTPPWSGDSGILVNACPESTDGGTSVDAGSPVDSGTPADASTPVDAGAPTDASSPVDATSPVDARTPIDATPPADTGTPEDAVTPTDATTPIDSGKPGDAGEPVDSGKADAGEPVDSGKADAGEPVDSGKADAGEPVDSGKTADAGGTIDAGKPSDSGVAADTGIIIVDASAPSDSSVVEDSGALVDEGVADVVVTDDASTTNDASSADDAISLDDTGTTPDAVVLGDTDASTDAAATSDTGFAEDSGSPAHTDAAADSGAPADAVNGSACGCRTAGADASPSTAALGGLVLAVGLMARRRRNRAHRG